MDASWGPQFASVNGVIFFGSTGNLTKDSSGLQSLLENRIPKFLVPLRYLIKCFAASMWPGDGLEVYLAIMLVIVATSGLVCVESQFRHPTYLRRIEVNFSFSVRDRSRSGTSSSGIERASVNGPTSVRRIERQNPPVPSAVPRSRARLLT